MAETEAQPQFTPGPWEGTDESWLKRFLEVVGRFGFVTSKGFLILVGIAAYLASFLGVIAGCLWLYGHRPLVLGLAMLFLLCAMVGGISEWGR